MTTLEPARRYRGGPYTPQPFDIEVRPDRERAIVAPRGELDLATVDQLRAELEQLVAAGFAAIVLDLRELSFMDSTGLCLIVEQCRRRDVKIELIDGSAPVSRLFDLTSLRQALPFVNARELRLRR